MDDPRRDPPDPFEAMADVPLFRELQRVLLQGTGPVNWELARQVGIAVAALNRDDPEPSEEDRRGFEDVVRAAELEVARFTGMEPLGHVSEIRCERRATWVEASTTALRPVVEPVASGLARALGQFRDAAPAAEAPMLEALMQRMAPLLLGAQVGTMVGYLGQRVLSGFDVAVPRGAASVSFVVPNIRDAERDWSLEPVEFRAWVALHEVAHGFALGRPWVQPHFVALVRELTESSELDLAGLEERLAGLDLSDPERLGDAFGSPSDLVGRTLTEEGRLVLGRLQAFLAAAEGHADHVAHGVGARMLTGRDRIEEAMRRRSEGVAGETRLVEQLLGIDTTPEQHQLGRAFCDSVAERTDESVLSRMWDSAENLPSMPELEEPTLWLSRIA